MRVDWINDLRKTMKETTGPVVVERKLLEWLIHCHDLHNKKSSVTKGPDGHLYVSQTALSRKLGVRQSTISNRLNKTGTMDGFSKNKKGYGKGNRNQKRIPVSSCGYHWDSITACAKDIKRERKTVTRWINEDQEKLHTAVMIWKSQREQQEYKARSTSLFS